MKNLLRLAVLLLIAVGLTAALPSSAFAKHVRHHHTHKYPTHKKSSGVSSVKIAQTHLANLGYYSGHLDGLIGRKTIAAIKAFQKDQGFKATGKLTGETMAALTILDKEKAMSSLPVPMESLAPPPIPAPLPDFYAEHQDFYGHYDQQHADALMLARTHAQPGDTLYQDALSRYAPLRITEDTTGAMKKYNVLLNNRPIMLINNQPSVIGVSRTFQLDQEDAILFTAYDPDNSICPFKHILLTLREGGTATHPLNDCTRGYQAQVKNNSLWITFPEVDSGRVVGATWRYESGDLERL